MAVALSTTKRKFHKILDSISNASNTSLVPPSDTKNASTTTLPSTFESPAKKARTTRPVSALVTSIPRVSQTRLRASSTASRFTTVSAMPTTVHGAEPPAFAPWDRVQFLKRLESFRHVDKWMSKPEKINEVQWAKRGWSCVGRDTVRCVGGCSHEVVIKLEGDSEETVKKSQAEDVKQEEEGEDDEDDWREKAQEQLVEKYVEKIVTGHAAGCLWRRRGCDDIIFRLPLYHQANAITNLRQRYESLLKMAADLPTNLSTPSSFRLSDYQPEIASILQSLNTSSTLEPSTPSRSHPPSPTRKPPAPPLNREAFILAMFGWQAETGHIAGLATCGSCFRRLGLWLFIPRTLPNGEEKEATMARLDVVGEHRDYCPWIDALSQNGPPSRPNTSESQTASQDKNKAGWELLARLVLNVVRAKRREEKPAAPLPTLHDRGDEISVSSTFATGTTAVEAGSKDETEKEKERWARLKRIKQAFKIRRGKKKDDATTA